MAAALSGKRNRLAGTLLALTALAVTYAAATGRNPLAGAQDVLDRVGSLSRPAPAWNHRMGAPPERAVVAGNVVLITRRGGIEARDAATGAAKWDRVADWSAIAGPPAAPVPIVGRRTAGLVALDPVSGQVRWRDPQAVGAWTFVAAVLVLTCAEHAACAISARAPQDGAVRWRTTVPGLSLANAGANPRVLGPRDASPAFSAAALAAPGAAPPILGIPVDARVELIDTTDGHRPRAVAASGVGSRTTIAGDRVVVTTAHPAGERCRYRIEARSATGKLLWQRSEYDPGTVAGAGCDQRKAPTGDGSALAVARADGRPALLGLTDGTERWAGGKGSAVIAISGGTALVRSSDGRRISALDSATGTVRWELPAARDASITLCREVTLVTDRTAGRLTAYDTGSGRSLTDLRTRADVLGCGPSGLLLARGRTIGLIKIGSPAGAGEGSG